MPALSKKKRYLKAASNAAASKRRREAEELSRHLLPSPPLPSESLLDDSDTDLCGSDSESEFSDQELEQRDHWEDEDCIDNTLSEPRPNAFTQLKYKEGADSRLRGLYAKWYSRDHCEYNFEALRRTVPDALSSVPPRTIAAFHSRCQRRMEAYRLGLNYGTEEFKNYASHRRVRTEEDDM